ncbi:hypothetical protein BDZ85DRAFT_206527 [Elsinoe ampelina]|uniref:Zn(2)-C6 fungal-type domain-containing protein n=1 Tax=Elsinoe ampelina TaxID=302913 RepID=A0A6A6G0P9_9PEZI|nr:hypothetical protein BDZ85DRAFT_206527 [Elsinoe ampelina]
MSSAPIVDKRLLRACDSCYKRKIKCDGVRPRCEWCSSHGIDCTFFRQPRVRKKRDVGTSEYVYPWNDAA